MHTRARIKVHGDAQRPHGRNHDVDVWRQKFGAKNSTKRVGQHKLAESILTLEAKVAKLCHLGNRRACKDGKANERARVRGYRTFQEHVPLRDGS
jgi:hypothetical protein